MPRPPHKVPTIFSNFTEKFLSFGLLQFLGFFVLGMLHTTSTVL